MFDQKFLKTLCILYVEDSRTIRVQMTDFLSKLFKQVITATDGREGLEKFKNQNNIDVIISDINMPNMDGIEMVAKIRKFDDNVPFIFTTAHSETEYALNAIKYGVSHYATKPINAKELLVHINDICSTKYKHNELCRTKIELERYMDIVEQVSIISRTDTRGIITYVNDTFCENSKYSRDELIGQNHNIVRHPDMPSLLFKNLWDDIKAGKTWKSKVKNRAKNGESYYINTSIFPVCKEECDNDVIEYISISFLTTKEELQKKEFRNKVLLNVQESNRRDITSRTKINELEIQLEKYKNFDIIEDSLENEKKKANILKTQINSYEKSMEALNQRLENIVTLSNEKISASVTISKKIKNKNDLLVQDIESLKSEFQESKELNFKLNNDLQTQAKTIQNLNDVIEHRESQINGLNK